MAARRLGDPKLAANIRRMMKERGWTQRELAERLGVPKSSVYNFVNAINGTTVYTLRRMRAVFECTWEELLE